MVTGAPMWCTSTWRTTQWRSTRWAPCELFVAAWVLLAGLLTCVAYTECIAFSNTHHREHGTSLLAWLCAAQVHPRNSGRDPFPVFLRRGPLPREKPRGQTLTGRIPKSLCYRCVLQSVTLAYSVGLPSPACLPNDGGSYLVALPICLYAGPRTSGWVASSMCMGATSCCMTVMPSRASGTR